MDNEKVINLKNRKPLPNDFIYEHGSEIVAATECGYGSMGEEGVVNIITKNYEIYETAMGFPSSIFYMHDTDGENGKHHNDWCRYYTGGGGNFLYIRKEYEKAIKDFMKMKYGERSGYVEVDILYQHRFEAIEYALKHTKIDDKS